MFAVEVVVNMKRLTLLALLLTLSVEPLWAADPSGDWLVEDGSAKIRVAICQRREFSIEALDRVSSRVLDDFQFV